MRASTHPRTVLPRPYLQACIHLLLSQSPSHGYDLVPHLAQFGIQTPDKGLVYRVLREMEGEGLVVSFWEPAAGGPPRRTYSLTTMGVTRLDTLTDTLRQAHRSFSAFVDRFDHLDSTSQDDAAA